MLSGGSVCGGAWCIKDNIEAGANSRAHHSLGRGLVPRKQRTPTRAPAPTAGRLASQLPAGHVGSSAGNSPTEQQRHRPEADPWCPPVSGRAERAGEGGREPHVPSHLKPSKETKNQGHRGDSAPAARMAENAGF